MTRVRVGFAGLGSQGGPMARRVIEGELAELLQMATATIDATHLNDPVKPSAQ